MLRRVAIRQFTVFRELALDCSPGLNVVVGENSSGKSHLLKLLYALIATSASSGKQPHAQPPTKAYLQKAYGEKLLGVFRPESLGRLVSRRQGRKGRERCEVDTWFDNPVLDVGISFATNSKTDVQIDTLPSAWEAQSPLYLPTRELLTIYPNFVAIYEGHYLEFEETWRDTCIHLGGPLQKGPRTVQTTKLIEPIEHALGGKVVLAKNGRFYLRVPGGDMEMPLVAEGCRKLAMLAQLIANGVIQAQGYLFWDEPEANLNPCLIRQVAQVIHGLVLAGVQVFIASHSFFLLKELELLSRYQPVPQKFIGLYWEDDAIGVSCEQAEVLSGLNHIVALDEELAQYDRELQGGA